MLNILNGVLAYNDQSNAEIVYHMKMQALWILINLTCVKNPYSIKLILQPDLEKNIIN